MKATVFASTLALSLIASVASAHERLADTSQKRVSCGPSARSTLRITRLVTITPTCFNPSMGAAQGKAFTSASAKAPTTAMLENVQKNPGAATLVNIPGFLILGGGVPIKVGNEVIGAVGVGGAPGGHLDEACANAGIAKVADLLK